MFRRLWHRWVMRWERRFTNEYDLQPAQRGPDMKRKLDIVVSGPRAGGKTVMLCAIISMLERFGAEVRVADPHVLRSLERQPPDLEAAVDFKEFEVVLHEATTP